MNRRSFVSTLASLPFLSPLAALAAPSSKKDDTITTFERLRVHYHIWSEMKGLKRCVDPEARRLGVKAPHMTWWFPLTLLKNGGFATEMHTWWKTLPEA